MRRLCLGILLFLIPFVPAVSAAQSVQVLEDFVYKENDLKAGKYDERIVLILPEQPLAFAVEIPWQASVENKRSGGNNAVLTITALAPGGGTAQEAALKPGDKKSGVIRLAPFSQLRVELYAGKYAFLFIKSGADVKCRLKWPEMFFIAKEQIKYYGFNFHIGGWSAVDRWEWDFGDGRRGVGSDVEHVYRQPGAYRLQVVGYQRLALLQTYQRDFIVPDFIVVNPQVGPLEGAVEMNVGCHSGLTAHYGEQAQSYWDFGDGVSVIGDDAEHIYRQPGRYVITMMARHLGSDYAVRQTFNVLARPFSIENKGLVNPAEGPIPFSVDCQAQPRVDGSPVDLAYYWDFGDGNFAGQARATHTYGDVGQYLITLRVVDRLHPEIAVPVMTYTVRAQPPGLTVNPAANPLRGMAPLTVLFTTGVTVKGYPVDLRYRWDFGDGTTAKEANPIHTYDAPGEYDARLTVTDALYRTEARGQLHISAASPRILASVTVEPGAGQAPLSIVCNAQAASEAGAGQFVYEWDFGDGTRGAGQTIAHVYSRPGQYRIILAVRDATPGRAGTAQAAANVTVF